MTKFHIRKALPEDAEKVAFVRITGWRQSYAGLMPDALLEKLDIAADARRVKAALEDPAPKSMRFVVELEGEIVGMGACGSCRDAGDPKRGEVYAIYLLDSAKRRGIGQGFMREMAAALKAQGYESLQVSVLESNLPARNFYEKLGGKLLKSGVFTFEGYDLPDVTYCWDDISRIFGENRQD